MAVQSVRAFEVVCCECDAKILVQSWEKLRKCGWSGTLNGSCHLCPKCVATKVIGAFKGVPGLLLHERRWNYGATIQGFYQSAEGEWVKWEEAKQTIASLTAELEQIKEKWRFHTVLDGPVCLVQNHARQERIVIAGPAIIKGEVADQRQDELWKEFLATGLVHCGLCGDTGLVSHGVISRSGFTVSIKDRPCICPNGRAIKAQREAAKSDG